MVATSRTGWIVGTVTAVLAVLAAAWFLLVSPTLAETETVRLQTQETVQRNDLLEMQLIQLRADFEKLPEYKQELANLRTQIPTDAQLSTYLRQIDEVAVRHGVRVTIVAPGVPEIVSLGAVTAPPAPVAEPTADETPAEASQGAGEPVEPPAPAGPAVPAGLVTVPLSLSLVGTYDATLAFVADLQTVVPRLLLVTAFAATGLQEGAEGGGLPATAVGDQEIVLSGNLFVLPDPSAAPSEPQEPAALPGATPGKNPLVPVAGG